MNRLTTVLGMLLVMAGPGYGQQLDVRTELVARGAPSEFADRVHEIVRAAEDDGLPSEPIATKALEGWAKRRRVPPDRILAVLSELSDRLRVGKRVTVEAGYDAPPGLVVAAAAEALGRAMAPDDIRAILASAPTPEAAATGLLVSSSLVAQGLETAAAVKAVNDAYRHGRSAEQVLELPSTVAGLTGEGVPMSDVARQILEGGGLPLRQGGQGWGKGRNKGVPPSRGPPPNAGPKKEPPGKAKGKGNSGSS